MKKITENKICPACKRIFFWRRKWLLNWQQVKYCSKKCSYNKKFQ